MKTVRTSDGEEYTLQEVFGNIIIAEHDRHITPQRYFVVQVYDEPEHNRKNLDEISQGDTLNIIGEIELAFSKNYREKIKPLDTETFSITSIL